MTIKSRSDYITSELPHSGFIKKLYDTDQKLIIFDVGACECEDSIKYIRLFPNAEVYAFEPSPNNLPLIKQTFERFGTNGVSDRIHVVTSALSDVPGSSDLYISSGNPSGIKENTDWNYGNKSSSLLKPDSSNIQREWKWLNFNEVAKVPTTTLDIFTKANNIDHIDLLSIDVQGAELLVLKGGINSLINIQAVWLEVSQVPYYTSQPLAKDIYTFMKDHGFILISRIGSGNQYDELYISYNHPRKNLFRELITHPYVPIKYISKLKTHTTKNTKSQLADTLLGSTEIDTEFGTMNLETRETWLERVLSTLPVGSTILDAGAGNTRYRNFCQHLIYTSQDFNQYDGKGDGAGIQTGIFDQTLIDIISDIVQIPVPENSFDNIMCIEVIEHIPDPISALKEFQRILKPGGKLIITAPFASITHYSPYFFQTGYSKYFYHHWYEKIGFNIEDISYNGSYYSWLAQELRRLPDFTHALNKHKGLSRERRKSLKTMIDWLEELEKKSYENQVDPSDLLCYGLQVVAHKINPK